MLGFQPVVPGAGQALVFQTRDVPEIHEQAYRQSSCVKIVQELRAMLIGQFRNGLEFHHYRFEANQVRLVGVFQGLSLVLKPQRWLGDKSNFLKAKFYLEAFLVNRLQKAAAFFAVNLKTGAENPVGFLFVGKVVLAHGGQKTAKRLPAGKPES